MGGRVTAVSRNERYGFSKPTHPFITLLAGLGVEGMCMRGRQFATSSA